MIWAIWRGQGQTDDHGLNAWERRSVIGHREVMEASTVLLWIIGFSSVHLERGDLAAKFS